MNSQFQNTPPKPPVKRHVSRFTPKMLFIGGGITVALILIVVFFALSSANSPVSQMQRLSARFESLQMIVDLGTKDVRGPDLKKVQSDASILISSNTVVINDAMKTAGLDKVPKEVKTLEADTATLKTLTDAHLNGQFDTAYQKALSQKLEGTMALMQEIHGKTNSKKLKTALATGYIHFGNLLDQLSKL